jgi:hypothetical protein
MSILNAIKEVKRDNNNLQDMALLPQALIMQMAQRGEIQKELVPLIISKKAEMIEAVARQRALMQGGAQQPSVMEQKMMEIAQAENPAPEPQMMPQPMAQMPAQLPEDVGIAQNPTPPMQMAGGGIIAFAPGGDVDEDDDEDESIFDDFFAGGGASKKNKKVLEEKKKEEAKDETKKAEGEAKKTNFMEDFELPKEVTITAWYTPEIPISQGPENYWGLPGLILEVSDGKTVVLCSKIVMNSKEKAEIKAPTKGKEISQKEYDETVTKKMEEFRQMNQGRGGNGTMQIRMGR